MKNIKFEKNKVIIIFVIVILIIGIIVFNIKKNDDYDIDMGNEILIKEENSKTKENNEDEKEIVIIHVSGEVNNPRSC